MTLIIGARMLFAAAAVTVTEAHEAAHQAGTVSVGERR